MVVNFTEALRTLPPDAAFRIANSARPSSRYLWSQILPERPSFDWDAKAGSMKVITTMAGLVGMDSPYPEGGAIVLETFSENVAKIAIASRMPEKMLRDLYQFVREIMDRGGDSKQQIIETALNFTQKLLVQPHIDRAEWLRSQALTTGAIDWTFGGKTLSVDYGIPAANMNAQRTGNDGYGGSASKFWDDIKFIRQTLKDVRMIVVSPATADMIRYNAANSMATIAESDGGVTFRRLNSNEQFTQDVADTVTLVKYGLEGEVLDLANPGATIKVPFMPDGLMVGIGNNVSTAFTIGAGSTDEETNELGYTHLAPTVEGNFQRGRWARVFVPESRPWSIEGESVSNLLPVIENPNLIATASTEMV